MSRSKHFRPGEVVQCVAVSTSSIAERDWEPAIYWARPTTGMSSWHWVKRVRHNAFGEKTLVPARRVRAWPTGVSSRLDWPSDEDRARLSPVTPGTTTITPESVDVYTPDGDHALSVPCPTSYCRAAVGDRCKSAGGVWVAPHRPRAEKVGRVAPPEDRPPAVTEPEYIEVSPPPIDVYLPVGEHDPARKALREYLGERARFRGHLSRTRELLASVDSTRDACLPLSDSVAAVLQAVGNMIASGARLDALELARRKK